MTVAPHGPSTVRGRIVPGDLESGYRLRAITPAIRHGLRRNNCMSSLTESRTGPAARVRGLRKELRAQMRKLSKVDALDQAAELVTDTPWWLATMHVGRLLAMITTFGPRRVSGM